jgi:hypothetical protein
MSESKKISGANLIQGIRDADFLLLQAPDDGSRQRTGVVFLPLAVILRSLALTLK